VRAVSTALNSVHEFIKYNFCMYLFTTVYLYSTFFLSSPSSYLFYPTEWDQGKGIERESHLNGSVTAICSCLVPMMSWHFHFRQVFPIVLEGKLR
jgi:hypothetical protein